MLLCTLFIPPAFGAGEDLPDIGSPSDTILSKELEAQIGRSIYKSLRDAGQIVTDPEIRSTSRTSARNLRPTHRMEIFSLSFSS